MKTGKYSFERRIIALRFGEIRKSLPLLILKFFRQEGREPADKREEKKREETTQTMSNGRIRALRDCDSA